MMWQKNTERKIKMVEVYNDETWRTVLNSINSIEGYKRLIDDEEVKLQVHFDKLTEELTEILEFKPKRQAVMINNFEETDMIVSISSTLFGLETVEKVKEWMSRFRLSDFRVDGEWTRIIFKVK